MRLGCGVRVKESHGRKYVDVWRYETRGGRMIQVFEYVGARYDPETEGAVAKLLERHRAAAMEEFRRRALRVGHGASSD